ncbi:MoaD/ThiS family protein [Sulfurihydrogenibium azorense]|jgi:molybdopterin synthase sulfur carrier subunit|uniref:MoaD family protein n=1 Tax=Sulfurihydrogenibium azorense (strain DSM 15241 / OCM 825 / Az-Fu1) TaxID=204536 RepID=C1DTP2_SULAA|nr:MoaD/ThiS family protein [Sulfurihydrogenibium azorense]ACN98869.1 MoaD family protein [Sulfurihydrogenibium azorense Az-Fu1]MDM7274462.1 MoaD/ThiS family protein [Sulfurihydrogenibium azorense]
MAITVRIPTALRRITQGQGEVSVEASNIAELIDALEKEFPGIKERLVDENGEIRKFVNFFVNDEDIRFLQGKDTPLKDGDVVAIIPAIAGGNK